MAHSFPTDRTVTARLDYIRPDSRLNRRYVAPGAEMNTGHYESRTVTIADARQAGSFFTLSGHGFELIHHKSAVTDFRDADALGALYLREMERVVQRLTGADKVIAFGALLRDVENPGEGAQPAGTDVHTDFTPRRARSLARSLLEKESLPDKAGEQTRAYSRFEAINLWRALSPAPQNMPLALCDAGSVDDTEGVANSMVRVDRLPEGEDVARPLSEEEQMLEASLFTFRPYHRWYYYPDMRPDELLVFRLYDSRETGPWRTPHAAFFDTSVPHPVPRVSVEARTVAYFR